MTSKSDINKCIEIINHSKYSHETWASYYMLHPSAEEYYKESVGDLNSHVEQINLYIYVINTLTKVKELFEENNAYATCPCCGSGWSGT
jgi:hypothetical protein